MLGRQVIVITSFKVPLGPSTWSGRGRAARIFYMIHPKNDREQPASHRLEAGFALHDVSKFGQVSQVWKYFRESDKTLGRIDAWVEKRVPLKFRFPIDPRIETTWLRRIPMLRWALTFFIVALIAAVLGFTGVAVAAAGIAKILFYLFLILFLITLIGHLLRRA